MDKDKEKITKSKMHAFSQNQVDEFDSNHDYNKFESDSHNKKAKFFSDGMHIESSESYHDTIMRKEYASNHELIDHHENLNEASSTDVDKSTSRKLSWYQAMFKHEHRPFWFAAILALSIFLERFCFVVIVYKTREHGYILILCVAFLNSMFSLLNSSIKMKKHKRKLYENFQLRKTPKVGFCIFILISILDMFYVFFLFWPANVIPIACLITLLQLLIPFNIVYQSHYLVHRVAGVIILIACLLCFARVIFVEYDGDALKYCAFLVLSAVLEAISLGIKEGLVRSQPINNEKFNFKVSLGQFIVGIMIMPIIVDIYTSSIGDKDKNRSTWENIGVYVVDGLECVSSFSGEPKNSQTEGCSYSLLYIIGYTVATFLFQIVLKALLERRQLAMIKNVFAFTIPLTILAFLLGAVAIPGSFYGGINFMDYICVGLAFIGVFLYNHFEEKHTKLKEIPRVEH